MIPPREVYTNTECSPDTMVPRTFWDNISTFWDFLDSKSRGVFENFWESIQIVGYSLNKKANRFVDVTAPENSQTCVYDDYYEIKIGPLFSKPLNLDPTIEKPSHIINAIGVISQDPVVVDDVQTRQDYIEIKAADYYAIRSVGIGCYAVIGDQYFKVLNLKSPEEGARYYWKYIVEVDGDLTYLNNKPFSFYLTTGLCYDIDKNIIDVPNLRSTISGGDEFQSDVDYRFYNHTVEFLFDLYTRTNLKNGDFLYCYKATSIEDMLYEMYGSLVFIDTYERFNHLNISGKAAICALLMSIQDVSKKENFTRALNVYYGMPVAPDDCEVIGLYESYGYEVIDKNGNDVTVLLQSEPAQTTLHPFIVSGSWFHIDGKKEVIVDSVDSSGIITLENASDIVIGDKMYLRLNNRMTIKAYTTSSIDVYTYEGKGGIKHLIDTIQTVSGGKRYPEIVVTKTPGIDGVYHITNVTDVSPGVIRLHIYSPQASEDPLYNDYIAASNSNVSSGFVHIEWPTHKFLYLYLSNMKKYFKAYLDSPIDTIYDSGDNLSKYDTIARNVSIFNELTLNGWEQYDQFRRCTGINSKSDILEMTFAIPDAKYGQYFPSQCVTV